MVYYFEPFEQLIPSNLRNDKTYITWYIVSLYFIVMNFVPFTLLAILNGAIYKQVSALNTLNMYICIIELLGLKLGSFCINVNPIIYIVF